MLSDPAASVHLNVLLVNIVLTIVSSYKVDTVVSTRAVPDVIKWVDRFERKVREGCYTDWAEREFGPQVVGYARVFVRDRRLHGAELSRT
jgi:hypothetical protein